MRRKISEIVNEEKMTIKKTIYGKLVYFFRIFSPVKKYMVNSCIFFVFSLQLKNIFPIREGGGLKTPAPLVAPLSRISS